MLSCEELILWLMEFGIQKTASRMYGEALPSGFTAFFAADEMKIISVTAVGLVVKALAVQLRSNTARFMGVRCFHLYDDFIFGGQFF